MLRPLADGGLTRRGGRVTVGSLRTPQFRFFLSGGSSFAPKLLFDSSPAGDTRVARRKSTSDSAAIVYATRFTSIGLKQPSIDDTPHRVYICCTKSPTDFYIQYLSCRELLAHVNANVGKCSAHAERLVDPVAGLPCIALFP